MGLLSTRWGDSRVQIDSQRSFIASQAARKAKISDSTNKNQPLTQPNHGLQMQKKLFCDMRYDASFKHIYSVDNYKYGLGFARDIATLTGHTSLAHRVATVKKHDFTRTSMETALSARTTQEKQSPIIQGTAHIRSPDVMCTVNQEIRVHIEMQQKNHGNIERRTREYENLADQYFGFIPTIGISVNAYSNPNWADVDWKSIRNYRKLLRELRADLESETVTQAIKPPQEDILNKAKYLIELLDSTEQNKICPQDVKELETTIGKLIDIVFPKLETPKSQNTTAKKTTNKRNVRPKTGQLEVRIICNSKLLELSNKLKRCYTLKKSDDPIKVNYANLDGVEQLNVALYLGNAEKKAIYQPKEYQEKIEEIRNRWDEEIKKRTTNKTKKEKAAIEQAGNRICQRNIALQYLPYFSEDDFEKYITDPTIREECSYVSLHGFGKKGITRMDIIEQFEEAPEYPHDIEKIMGEIDGIVQWASTRCWGKALLGILDKYPQRYDTILSILNEKLSQLTVKTKRNAIANVLEKMRARKPETSDDSEPTFQESDYSDTALELRVA